MREGRRAAAARRSATSWAEDGSGDGARTGCLHRLLRPAGLFWVDEKSKRRYEVAAKSRVGKPLNTGMPEAWWDEVATPVWERFCRAAIAAGRRTKTNLARFDGRGRMSWGNVIQHELAKGPVPGFSFDSDFERRALCRNDKDTTEPRGPQVPLVDGPGTRERILHLAQRYQTGEGLFSPIDTTELRPDERPNVRTRRRDHAEVA